MKTRKIFTLCKKDTLIIFFLFFLPFIFFYKIAFLKEVFFGEDITFQNYPQRVWVAEQIKKGIFPLWSPNIFCGYPILAEGQTSILYPFNLLFLFLPGFISYHYLILLHFALSGIFMYFLCRTLKLSRTSSIISSILFTFCPIFLTAFQDMSKFNASIWLPLIFYLILIYYKTQKIIYILLASIIFGVQFLSFHPATSFYILLALSFYFIYKIILNLKNSREILNLLSRFSLIIYFGVGLSAVQLIPTFELTRESIRWGGLRWNEIVQELINPFDFFKDSLEGYLLLSKYYYLHLFSFIFAFIAIFLRREKFILFLAISSFVSLLLAINIPFLNLIYYLPGFNLTRFPTSILFLFFFFISILSGYGIDVVLNRYFKREFSKSLFKVFTICLVIFLLILNFRTTPIKRQKPNFLTIMENYYENLKRVEAREVCITDKKIYTEIPSFVNFLKKDKGTFRVLSGEGGYLQPNVNFQFDISSASGYSPIAPLRYWQFVAAIDERKFMDMVGVKYFLTKFPVDYPDKLVYNKEIMVYENINFYERAYLVHKYINLNSEKEVLDLLGRGVVNLKETVLLTEPTNLKSPKYPVKQKGVVKILNYEPTKIEIYTKLPANGFLILQDAYYPGWNVYVDGRKDKIYKANYLFRGVALNKGEHKIIFVYFPLSCKIGIFITIYFLILIVLLTFYIKKFKIIV